MTFKHSDFMEKLGLALSLGLRKQGEIAIWLDISERTFRTLLAEHGILSWPDYKRDFAEPVDDDEDDRPIAGGSIQTPEKTRRKLDGKRFVFTSAQNNTLIHEGFYGAILGYCQERDARLVVSRFAYNKSGWKATKSDEDLWYDERLEEYFVDFSARVDDCDLIWCGELDINPTGANPLTGLHSYTQSDSGIVPHAKVQLQSLPVFKGDEPKTMYTTGTITQRNYIERKTGQIASFHHTFAALVVEINDDGTWWARHIIGDDNGNFYDLDRHYTADGSTAARILAINYGDVHAEKSDTDVALASWSQWDSSMLSVLRPQYQFVHDVSDFMARNHHNRDDAYFLAEMRYNETESVAVGLDDAGNILNSMWRQDSEVVVVHSNHDAALKLWMKNADIKRDPVNAKFWHWMNYKMYSNIERGNPSYDPFADYLLDSGVRARFLAPDDSLRMSGIEFGMHGHMGLSGSRGSNMQFKKLNVKVNVGHTHSPQIVDGVYCAGVSGNMEMGYNKGPTTWQQAHVITYMNGKRAIVTIKKGDWKA